MATKDIQRTTLYRKTVALVGMDKRRYKRELSKVPHIHKGADDLWEGFNWLGSKQGHKFWSELAHHAESYI